MSNAIITEMEAAASLQQVANPNPGNPEIESNLIFISQTEFGKTQKEIQKPSPKKRALLRITWFYSYLYTGWPLTVGGLGEKRYQELRG